MALGDGSVAIPVTGSSDGLLIAPRVSFVRADGTLLPDSANTAVTLGAPARTRDGRLIVASRFGTVTALRGTLHAGQAETLADTVAPVAVSRSHIVVSTASGLRMLDATTLADLGRTSWQTGGESSPAIGADGRVYAIADHRLWVVPGAAQPCRGVCVPPGGGGIGGGVLVPLH